MSTLEERIEQCTRVLQHVAQSHRPARVASSLGPEDMVLTDLVYRSNLALDVFTLDTGRLPEATQRLLAQIQETYGRAPRVYFPQAQDVEAFVSTYGINGFYHSIEARRACCGARKVVSLRRALAGAQAWVTGLRREQSPTRETLAEHAWDEEFGLVKYNPLLDWSRAQVWDYLKRFRVPVNALHDQGFASIGCSPCTRAIGADEPERAGRWWWEHPTTKECGLHR